MLARRGLFVRSTSVLPSLRNARYGWSLNSTRAVLSTRSPWRPLGRENLGAIVPFSEYEDVVLVSRIQTFLDSQIQLEQDLKKSDLGPILGMAIETQKEDAVRFLLNKGADPNGWSYVEPISHLAQAAQFENLEIIRMLLDHGAHPYGCGALSQAAGAGNLGAAEMLIDRGAGVNEIISPKICDHPDGIKDYFRLHQLKGYLKDSKQGTPLHAAALEEEADMIEFLLGKGANKAIRNTDGETAADMIELNIGLPSCEYWDDCISEERREQIYDMLS